MLHDTGDASLFDSTLVAAAVAAAVSVTVTYFTGRRAAQDRQRELFAAAFKSVAEYREFPFIVLRRDGADPAGERKRISTDLSQVQSDLNAHKARLQIEAPIPGAHFDRLVAGTRLFCGNAIHEAWNKTPIESDSQIHAPDIDQNELARLDREFILSVKDHLSLLPSWARRIGRWAFSILPEQLRERLAPLG